MKRTLLTAMLAAAAIGASAQAYIDYQTAEMVERAINPTKFDNTSLRSRSLNVSVAPGRIALFVTGDENTRATIEALGGTVTLERAGILSVEMPAANVKALAETPGVKRIEASRKRRMLMNQARRYSKADDAHAGTNLDHGYDGTGVITSLVDGGIDPNHINFRDENDDPRVKAVYYGTSGNVKSYTTPSQVMSYTTDDRSEVHGTHVAGIMAGSYTDNGYYGVAPGSDIVMGATDFSDQGIINTIDAIVNYAKKSGQPAVLNLSMGDNMGAHDGQDSFSKLLASYGEDVIICASAGNEGEYKLGFPLDFTLGEGSATTLLFPQADVASYYIDDDFEFWSNGTSSFTMSVDLYDANGKLLENLATITKANQSSSFTTNNTLKSYFTSISRASAAGAISTENKRYNAYVSLKLQGKSTNSYRSPKAYIGVTITGKKGQKIYGYCTGYYSEFTNRGLAGFTDGSYDGTISGMACGDNVVVVGAYNTRNRVTLTSGGTYTWDDVTVGDLASFSSWGNIYGDRTLPHVLAPGQMIMSSINSYYTETPNPILNGSVKYGGRTYYWDVEAGTSMSSPYAAGTIAVWLQADPTLKFDDVIDVINHTSTRDTYYNKSDKKDAWGAGKINVYEGLRYILQSSGVAGITPDAEAILFNQEGTNLQASLPGATGMKAVLYNLSGMAVMTVNGTDEINIDGSSLGHGVYVLKVETANASLTRKISL